MMVVRKSVRRLNLEADRLEDEEDSRKTARDTPNELNQSLGSQNIEPVRVSILASTGATQALGYANLEAALHPALIETS